MPSNFEVIHLSTSQVGGAGIAAKRLHAELQRIGIKSRLITSSDAFHDLKENSGISYLVKKYKFKLTTALNLFVSKRSFFSVFSESNFQQEFFSLGPTEAVIHVHNWFNLVNFEDFSSLAKLGYKFVFTLHDERILTGGCHCSLNCKQFSICHSCPELPAFARSRIRNNFEMQRRFLENYSKQLILVAPSKWMLKQIQLSGVNSNTKVIHIRNFNEVQTLQEFLAPVDWRGASIVNIGVASVDPYNYIKGGEFIRQIEYETNHQTTLGFRLIYMKDFSSQEEFWSNIHFLLVPSVSDNSPNVISEAILNFKPVIATSVGGIPELLNLECDRIIEPDIGSLFEAIESLKLDQSLPKVSTALINRYHTFLETNRNVLQRHLEIYQSLMES